MNIMSHIPDNIKQPKMSKRLKHLEHHRITQSHPYQLYFSRCFGKDAHACRCIDCEPSVQDNMFAEPYHFVKGQEEELRSKEVADTLELQFQQELRPMARGHAQKEAYEAARKEIDDQEKQREKAQIKKEAYEQAKAELEPKLCAGLTPIIHKEIQDKISKLNLGF